MRVGAVSNDRSACYFYFLYFLFFFEAFFLFLEAFFFEAFLVDFLLIAMSFPPDLSWNERQTDRHAKFYHIIAMKSNTLSKFFIAMC